MWVIFTEDGIPRWFGADEPVAPEYPETKEFVPGADERMLLTSRRVAGKWEPRGKPIIPEPTQQEVEAAIAAEYQAAVELVEADRRNAYREESDPLFFKWQAGETTEEEWKKKRAEIRERFPMPKQVLRPILGRGGESK